MYPWPVDNGNSIIFDRPYRDPTGWKPKPTKKQLNAAALGKASAQHRIHQAITKRSQAPKKK